MRYLDPVLIEELRRRRQRRKWQVRTLVLVLAAALGLGACDNAARPPGSMSTEGGSTNTVQDTIALTSDQSWYMLLVGNFERVVHPTLVVLSDQEPGHVLLRHQVRRIHDCQVFDADRDNDVFGPPPPELRAAVIDLVNVCRGLGDVKAGDVMTGSDLEALSAAVARFIETVDRVRYAW